MSDPRPTMNAWYMSGAGNDFMVIDARGLSLDFSKLAQDLCKKMDCDGFMAVDHSDVAHFKLHFYNADGSPEGNDMGQA